MPQQQAWPTALAAVAAAAAAAVAVAVAAAAAVGGDKGGGLFAGTGFDKASGWGTAASGIKLVGGEYRLLRVELDASLMWPLSHDAALLVAGACNPGGLTCRGAHSSDYAIVCNSRTRLFTAICCEDVHCKYVSCSFQSIMQS